MPFDMPANKQTDNKLLGKGFQIKYYICRIFNKISDQILVRWN